MPFHGAGQMATRRPPAGWLLLPALLFVATHIEAQEQRHPHPPVPGKQLPGDDRPTRLMLYIGGGIFPPNYTMEFRGDSLVYHASEDDPKTHTIRERTRVITPTADQWRRFWKAMDEVDLWNWRPRYDNPLIADGTKWDLDVEYAGRRIASSGSNTYPGGAAPGPKPSQAPAAGPPGTSKQFEAYLSAVRELLGGEPFR